MSETALSVGGIPQCAVHDPFTWRVYGAPNTPLTQARNRMKEITELTEDDSDWVESLVYTLGTLGVSTEPSALDAFLEHACATWTLEGSDSTPLINLLGAGVGHHLATELGLRWVHVDDARGQRLALYGDSKKTLAFPLDAVARRWAGEAGSLARYVHATTAAITQIRAGLAS